MVAEGGSRRPSLAPKRALAQNAHSVSQRKKSAGARAYNMESPFLTPQISPGQSPGGSPRQWGVGDGGGLENMAPNVIRKKVEWKLKVRKEGDHYKKKRPASAIVRTKKKGASDFVWGDRKPPGLGKYSPGPVPEDIGDIDLQERPMALSVEDMARAIPEQAATQGAIKISNVTPGVSYEEGLALPRAREVAEVMYPEVPRSTPIPTNMIRKVIKPKSVQYFAEVSEEDRRWERHVMAKALKAWDLSQLGNRALLEDEDFELAIRCFQQAIILFPNGTSFYNSLELAHCLYERSLERKLKPLCTKNQYISLFESHIETLHDHEVWRILEDIAVPGWDLRTEHIGNLVRTSTPESPMLRFKAAALTMPFLKNSTIEDKMEALYQLLGPVHKGWLEPEEAEKFLTALVDCSLRGSFVFRCYNSEKERDNSNKLTFQQFEDIINKKMEVFDTHKQDSIDLLIQGVKQSNSRLSFKELVEAIKTDPMFALLVSALERQFEGSGQKTNRLRRSIVSEMGSLNPMQSNMSSLLEKEAAKEDNTLARASVASGATANTRRRGSVAASVAASQSALAGGPQISSIDKHIQTETELKVQAELWREKVKKGNKKVDTTFSPTVPVAPVFSNRSRTIDYPPCQASAEFSSASLHVKARPASAAAGGVKYKQRRTTTRKQSVEDLMIDRQLIEDSWMSGAEGTTPDREMAPSLADAKSTDIAAQPIPVAPQRTSRLASRSGLKLEVSVSSQFGGIETRSARAGSMPFVHSGKAPPATAKPSGQRHSAPNIKDPVRPAGPSPSVEFVDAPGPDTGGDAQGHTSDAGEESEQPRALPKRSFRHASISTLGLDEDDAESYAEMLSAAPRMSPLKNSSQTAISEQIIAHLTGADHAMQSEKASREALLGLAEGLAYHRIRFKENASKFRKTVHEVRRNIADAEYEPQKEIEALQARSKAVNKFRGMVSSASKEQTATEPELTLEVMTARGDMGDVGKPVSVSSGSEWSQGMSELSDAPSWLGEVKGLVKKLNTVATAINSRKNQKSLNRQREHDGKENELRQQEYRENLRKSSFNAERRKILSSMTMGSHNSLDELADGDLDGAERQSKEVVALANAINVFTF